MNSETSYTKPVIGQTHTPNLPTSQRILQQPKKTLKVVKNYITKRGPDGRPQKMFSIKSITEEINKFIQQDKVQAEINRLMNELEKLGPVKALKEPTKKHLNELEKQYNFLMKRITQTQKQIDKEFNSAIKIINKRKKEAEGRFKKLQKVAFQQKKTIEKTIKLKLKEVTGTKKKKRTKRKTTKKKTTVRKTAKKKTARKKTT